MKTYRASLVPYTFNPAEVSKMVANIVEEAFIVSKHRAQTYFTAKFEDVHS